MILAWGGKVSFDFRRRVMHMGQRLGVDPSWLMACMYFESRLDPTAVNPQSGATGLIQFMPSTALELNTTVEQLRAMTAVAQLDYVERYLKQYVALGYKTIADVYMAIFWPAAVGKPGNYAIVSDETSKVYVQNKGLDLNKDGTITKDEAASYVIKALDQGMLYATEEREPRPDNTEGERTMSDAVQTVAGVATIFNPVLGGVIGLAGNLIKSFSPVIQEKLAKEINRHTDDPATGAKVANDIATMLVEQAKAFTGKPDDFQAVAAITSDPAQAQNLNKLEMNLQTKLDLMSAAGDKSSTWDQAKWDAELKSKQLTSNIAIAEKQAGLYDFTRLILWFAAITATMIALSLTSAIIYQAVVPPNEIDSALIGLAGPLLAIAMGVWREVFAYRFDGTKEATEQSKALIEAAKGK